MERLRAEEIAGEEWAEWYALSPEERFLESMKLWDTYLALGGSLEPEPDTQSPFFDPEEWRARTLLMGGQACVFYGAAEFSRDLDLLILARADNLARVAAAMEALAARQIAVPALDERHLSRGHAVHFRCSREDVAGLRVDIMTKLRGVADFEDLWERRTTIEIAGEPVDLLAIEDLVKAKKTQRNKDWPMIQRLIEQNYFRRAPDPSASAIEFWLRELRTPELLAEAAATYRERANALAAERPALADALRGDIEKVRELLDAEEREERRKDREYWDPLKKELEQLRHARGMRST